MAFTDSEISYLTSQRIGRLATAQPGGTLQVSPVGFGYNPVTGTIDIGGFNMSASRKFRNVTDNGRVAFVVDDVASVSPWRVRCVEIRGHAEGIETPTDAQAQIDGPIIRVHPIRVISFGIDDDPDTAVHDLVPNARNVSPGSAGSPAAVPAGH